MDWICNEISMNIDLAISTAEFIQMCKMLDDLCLDLALKHLRQTYFSLLTHIHFECSKVEYYWKFGKRVLEKPLTDRIFFKFMESGL